MSKKNNKFANANVSAPAGNTNDQQTAIKDEDLMKYEKALNPMADAIVKNAAMEFAKYADGISTRLSELDDDEFVETCYIIKTDPNRIKHFINSKVGDTIPDRKIASSLIVTVIDDIASSIDDDDRRITFTKAIADIREYCAKSGQSKSLADRLDDLLKDAESEPKKSENSAEKKKTEPKVNASSLEERFKTFTDSDPAKKITYGYPGSVSDILAQTAKGLHAINESISKIDFTSNVRVDGTTKRDLFKEMNSH